MKKVLHVILVIILIGVVGLIGYRFLPGIIGSLLTPSFSAETAISYMTGNGTEWTYGNQRKEFSDGKECYVRIDNRVYSNKRTGVGKDIQINYKFTGAENCRIELSDGKAQRVNSSDPNVVEFKRTVTATKKKNSKEDFIIFQYYPNGAKNVVLEVTYDDNIKEKYDDRNTVYFK